jgi:hypothetical protein
MNKSVVAIGFAVLSAACASDVETSDSDIAVTTQKLTAMSCDAAVDAAQASVFGNLESFSYKRSASNSGFNQEVTLNIADETGGVTGSEAISPDNIKPLVLDYASGSYQVATDSSNVLRIAFFRRNPVTELADGAPFVMEYVARSHGRCLPAAEAPSELE